MQPQVDISIVAPVYNEKNGIVSVLQNWIAELDYGKNMNLWHSWEIVLCDDKSTDGTREILVEFQRKDSRLILLSNEKNEGAGYSLARAIRHSKGTHVALYDSDGQFEASDISRMYEKLSHVAGICGFRQKQDRALHVVASRLSTSLSNFVLGSKIPDFNCQLKLLPGDLLRSFPFRATRMNYSGEITFLIVQSGIQVEWIPIKHIKRTHGKSNSKLLKDGFARLLFILYLGYENWLTTKRKILKPTIDWFQK